MTYMDDDHMEIGESGLIPLADGWFEDENGYRRAPDGKIYDSEGELIYDSDEEDIEGRNDEEDYEFYDR